jgi:hypothetical protein
MHFGEFIEQKAAEWQAPEAILAQFVAGTDDLARALDGLSEEALDLARATEKWSIRQIVHHVVHGDDVVGMRIKAAIGSPGSTWNSPWYDHQEWVESLDFCRRAIEPGLAFLRANRLFVAHVIEHLPDAWERHVLVERRGASEEVPFTVDRGITILACHIPWHVEQIRETRQVHGV